MDLPLDGCHGDHSNQPVSRDSEMFFFVVWNSLVCHRSQQVGCSTIVHLRNNLGLWKSGWLIWLYAGNRCQRLYSIYPSIYLYIYPSIYPSIYLYIHLSIHLSIYLTFYLSIYQYINQSINLSIYLYIYLSISLSIYLSICLSICLSVYYFLEINILNWYFKISV